MNRRLIYRWSSWLLVLLAISAIADQTAGQVNTTGDSTVDFNTRTAGSGFQPAEIHVPDGFVVELAAAPPLVTHPTMACFDDSGRLYVCNNAGVNMSNAELEQHLPNTIVRLEDRDQDGRFDTSTVFADKMTFPMGGVWHDGSLYVASPPNIWRLTDTDDDGWADQRTILVSQFGYSGNAASIHGCFLGSEGRIYWTDGYHGHEFKNAAGEVTSSREGSYLFSCRPDGSDTRIHCGGGMDNPVEIDFTDSGDMLGTVNIMYTRPREDCLVHWLHGGAYPHRERVLSEIKVTGDVLGAVHSFGHVAVSGMTRYRSGALQPNWQNQLFTTFFNSGQVVRLETERSGATYSATQSEFLSSPNREFHPTDVLEDADGSLLVIDTGGWFYRGCPTSQFAKPELLGAIYRVRRQKMTTLEDPRGLRINWSQLSGAVLTGLLGDGRFAVRQRAIEECSRRGASMLPQLQACLSSDQRLVRLGSVWTLARMVWRSDVSQAATDMLRGTLQDPLPEIRQAACLGLSVSTAKVKSAWIAPLLDDADAGVRRQAATTGGILRMTKLIPQLLSALDRAGIDRSEEHAIVYALIEIADSAAVREAWDASAELSSRQWRGAVIALDQMEAGQLRFDELSPGLHSDDPSDFGVAAGIAKRYPQWTPQLAQLFLVWLRTEPSAERGAVLESLLAALLHDPQIAAVAAGYLQEDQPAATHQLVLRAIGRAGAVETEGVWRSALERQLASRDDGTLRAAIQAVSSSTTKQFDEALASIASDRARSLLIRVDALAALVARQSPARDATLRELIGIYSDSVSPTAASRAAQIIGQSKLSQPQLRTIIPLFARASPMELRDLITGFGRGLEPETATAFLKAIERAPAFIGLADNEFSDCIKSFPPETLDAANRLLDGLKQQRREKLLRLENLRERLSTGEAKRGAVVFQNEKAKCGACHRVGEVGTPIGPDLTTIGANRSASDLLESIVFPSASLVRDYEPYKLLMADGRVLTGLVASESRDALELQQATGEKVVLRQSDIEQVVPSTVSLMPAGLEEALTEAELIDVVAYLQSLTR